MRCTRTRRFGASAAWLPAMLVLSFAATLQATDYLPRNDPKRLQVVVEDLARQLALPATVRVTIERATRCWFRSHRKRAGKTPLCCRSKTASWMGSTTRSSAPSSHTNSGTCGRRHIHRVAGHRDPCDKPTPRSLGMSNASIRERAGGYLRSGLRERSTFGGSCSSECGDWHAAWANMLSPDIARWACRAE